MLTEFGIRVGPFSLLDCLGRGGMAEVYRARHQALDQIVAIKVMTHDRAQDARYRADFRREVQAAARLHHPSIVRVFDYGLLPPNDDERFVEGSPYLVMEVADRGSLDKVRLGTWGSVRRMIMQVLDALAYSHARGVIHRDVKPANLLLASTPDGRLRVKLGDFGIAHADADAPRDMMAVGTFAYSPPEQLNSEWRWYGPATDLYALGCLVWQVLTGKPPFEGTTATQLAMRQMVAPLPEFVPRFEVPEGVRDWLGRLLEKQPHDRYQRAADAALAFMRLGTVVDEGLDFETDELLGPAATTGTGTLGETINYPDTIVVPALAPDEVESGAMASGSARALRADVVSGSSEGSAFDEVPELPNTWRRYDIDYDPAIAGLGLGLFGLREVPFVGREPERNAIWNVLRLIVDDRKCRAVVLRGVSGAGKSRLAQWITQRADEVGGGTVMRAIHASTRANGLTDLVNRFLVIQGLEGRQLQGHIKAKLRRIWPDADDEFLDGETAAVAAIARPHEHQRATTRERLATMARLIRGVSHRRPVVLWLDDAQWDVESIELAEYLASLDDLPVMVFLTVQEEAATELPSAEAALARLLAKDTADQLSVPPLDIDSQQQLVRRLIGLEDSLCRRVAAATQGNPLFAVHLVGDWVERGALSASRAGFTLKPGATTPADLHALWVRRVGYVSSFHANPEEQQIALEAAAALGGAVLESEWRAVCAEVGVRPDERLVARMVNLGMVVEEADGWRFIHRLLAASLQRTSEEAGRWTKMHASCAVALARTHGEGTEGLPERLANHLIAAERWEDALAPLKDAIEARLAHSDNHGALELLELFDESLARGESPSARTDVDAKLLRCTIARRMRGEVDEEELAEALETALANGWLEQVAIAHHEMGQIDATEGRLASAMQHYSEAFALLEASDSTTQLASLLQSRAWVHKSMAQNDLAEADLNRALDIHRENGDRLRELNTINSLAFTFLAAGDYEASREVAEIGISIGRELGHRGAEAGCWTTLGEIERFENNIDAARHCYEQAEMLDEMCGNKHAALVRSNAALLELLSQRWPETLKLIDASEAEMVAQGHGWMAPFFVLARSCCYAGLADWPNADAMWVEANGVIDASDIIERDVAWVAGIWAEAAAAHGEFARARRALEVARAHWVAMKDEREVRLVDERLAELGS